MQREKGKEGSARKEDKKKTEKKMEIKGACGEEDRERKDEDKRSDEKIYSPLSSIFSLCSWSVKVRDYLILLKISQI